MRPEPALTFARQSDEGLANIQIRKLLRKVLSLFGNRVEDGVHRLGAFRVAHFMLDLAGINAAENSCRILGVRPSFLQRYFDLAVLQGSQEALWNLAVILMREHE